MFRKDEKKNLCINSSYSSVKVNRGTPDEIVVFFDCTDDKKKCLLVESFMRIFFARLITSGNIIFIYLSILTPIRQFNYEVNVKKTAGKTTN
jgi:hypothetical protein